MGVSLPSREGFAGHGQQSGAPASDTAGSPSRSVAHSVCDLGQASPWLQGSAPL